MRPLRRRRGPPPDPKLDRWLVSYADLITLLFAFFATLYAISVLDTAKAQRLVQSIEESFESSLPRVFAEHGVLDQLPQGEGERAALGPAEAARREEQRALDALGERVRELRRALAVPDDVRVRQTEEGLVISLAGSLVFTAGGSEPAPESAPLIREIARLVHPLANQVRVEGHTDDRPPGRGPFASNWELSAARAAALLRRIEAAGVPAHRLQAAAFAAERPIASNRSDEGRRINRRVDVVVLRAR
jgi:chemotaxis protein MotB